MYLLDVFPIVKGTWAKDLQYWSTTHISPGSIVRAPLKGKEIAVFVFNCTPLQAAKHIVKEAEFKTRKIVDPTPITVIPHAYIQSILHSSGYFVQNIGAMLKACIPVCALSKEYTIAEAAHTPPSRILSDRNTDQEHFSQKRSDIVALSTESDNRISFYKSIIREEVAKNKSVILVAPTVRTAETLYTSIKKGVEHITYILHSGHTKKKQQDIWQTIHASERGIVIIVTPQYISIPRYDIETIILEHESSRAYKTFHPPYFDWRTVIEEYAKQMQARLILGDQLLRIETIKRVHDHEVDELFPLSHRIQKETEIIVVDMVEDTRKHGKYRMFSEELHSMIEYAEKKQQSIFLFTARRGLSPQTICSDCHYTVTCTYCKAPVVLHISKKTQKQERYFLCHHCGKERTALEACKKCNSWNLTTLGVGTDSVEQEVRLLYPHIPVFRIDKDAAKSDAGAKKIMQEFQKESFAILIGTETALSYIDTIKHVGVVSMESLFSIPDFRIHERIAHMYVRLLEIAESYLLIQSRNLENSIIRSLEQRTFGEYVKEELKVRELLQYPPYALMAKIVLKGTVQQVSAHAKKIQDELAEYNPQVFPAMIPSPEGPTIHILFTLPYTVWKSKERIQTELYRKLDLISRIAPIQVNPESFI